MDCEDLSGGYEVSAFDEVTIGTILNFGCRLIEVQLTVVLANIFIGEIEVKRSEWGIGFREFPLDFFHE